MGELPDWLQVIAQKIAPEKTFNQAIINEYKPGQGIGAHIDSRSFGDCIASLSLGSHCVMRFTKGDEAVDVFLVPRSVAILTGEARNDWKHEIPRRSEDPHPFRAGKTLKRSRRVSVTFRTVPLGN